MRSSHNARLGDRNLQDRGWAAPLPDFAVLPRANEAPRQRVELDTRDSINHRFWENVQVSGPTAVTTAMLAAHPTAGAETGRPMVARQDKRVWTAAKPYFPDVTGPGQRPMLPNSSLWANPHFDGWNPESIDTMRELRSVIKEDDRFRGDDASMRVAARSFEHQWLPVVSVEKLAAAEALRPAADDYRKKVVAASAASFEVGGQAL